MELRSPKDRLPKKLQHPRRLLFLKAQNPLRLKSPWNLKRQNHRLNPNPSQLRLPLHRRHHHPRLHHLLLPLRLLREALIRR
jgi:hypothetical protein